MKTFFVSFFLFLLTAQPGKAQTKTIDSLLTLVQNEKSDTSRCVLLAQLSQGYMESHPEIGLLLSQKGLGLAKSIQFTRGEALCLNAAALPFILTGNNAKALALLLDGLKKAEALHDTVLMSRITSNISYVYANQQDYVQCLKYNLESKNLSSVTTATYWINVLNLGDTYEKLNQLDSARYYSNQAYDYGKRNNDAGIMSTCLTNLGNIYRKMNQPEVAMANYRQSIPYSKQVEKMDAFCEAYLGMATLFAQMKQPDSSVYYAKKSFQIAKSGNFTASVFSAANFLASYYRRTDVVDSAYAYLTDVIAAKDSLFSQEKSNQIQNLSFDETMRQQEKAAQKSAAQSERRTNIQYGFIALGLVIFILFFLLISNSVAASEKGIRFLGVLGLLLVFEFINLYFHDYIADVTHHSPVLMLSALVAIAALLIPLHHRIEHWVLEKMIEKNKRLQIAAAKKTLARLADDSDAEKKVEG